MIFYIYLTLGVYFLFFLIGSLLKKKDPQSGADESSAWKGLVRAGVVLLLASALAFAMDSDKYLSVLEYNPYSMRGANPIVPSSEGGDSKTVEGGLGYKYATDWSFAPGELMTWLVPSWYGFGQVDYKGFFSNNQEMSVNFYWGPQPFTHAPQYMGVIVLIFAVIGFLKNRKDTFVQFMGIMIVVSLLIAFGREMPLLYDLMYRYFPTFNKFRIPSMILVLIQIFVPILAAYGIASFMRERNQLQGAELQKRKKSILVGAGVLVGVFVLLSLTFESFLPKQALQNVLAGFTGYNLPRDRVVDQFLTQVPAQAVREASSALTRMATNDMYIAIVLLIVTFGAIYFFIQNQMKYTTFIVVLTLVIGFDLWRIDVKPMEPHDKSVRQQAFATPEYVKYLQRDTTLYRVLEFQNGRPPYNNMLAYWRIQSAYRNGESVTVGVDEREIHHFEHTRFERSDRTRLQWPGYESIRQSVSAPPCILRQSVRGG
jgi:hypothetical protein